MKNKQRLALVATAFALLFLSAMPALDAQTRLMFNKRMEFWVSDKRKI